MDAINCFSVWKSVMGKNVPFLWQCNATSSWHTSSNIMYIRGTSVNAYLLTMFSTTIHSHLMPSYSPVHWVIPCLSKRGAVLAEGATQCRYCHNRHSAILPPKERNFKKETIQGPSFILDISLFLYTETCLHPKVVQCISATPLYRTVKLVIWKCQDSELSGEAKGHATNILL